MPKLRGEKPLPETLETTAKHYSNQQIPVVAVKQKRPLVEWAHWQTKPQTTTEFEAQPWQEADGYAIICGTKLDNGLYVGAVDFDVKNVSEEAQEKGKQILRKMLCTQTEQTPSGGQHWIYHCHNKPRTVSTFHNEYALEILGEGKLCIMAPSNGYKRLNDNMPSTINDLEQLLFGHLVSTKPEEQKTNVWFERADLAGKRYAGKAPPCIEALYRGAREGQRNEHAIRLASFLANFRKVRADNIFEQMRKINKLNDPPLDDQELQSIIKSALNGGYVYGCQDPLLKKNCSRDDCPIAPANIAKLLTQEETQRAEHLLETTNLLDQTLNYGKQRLIGENNTILANFIMFCSGQTRYPISGVISGFSGSGKNESIRAIKPLLPKEWYFEFTTSTPEAIKYLPEEFTGTLVIYEAAGVKGDSGSLSLKAIGEGESIETIYPMRNELTGKMEMGRAKTNAKNFITTSSDIDINPDLYRRVLKHTMNHSTQLTKRVMAKKIRDAAYPESLKKILNPQNNLQHQEQDFQNALRLLNWKLEAIAFTPTQLLKILDLAVKREQEVALRTHIEKIINFTKVHALLNQKQRLHVKAGDQEYVVAEPEDFLKALSILRSSITETISRIEKRQEEALKLFSTPDISLTKHDVASKLKVSTTTAYRALRTLSQAGYLKEDTSSKAYRYELLQEKPNHLSLLENQTSLSLFHQKSLEKWLNTTSSSLHAKGTRVELYNPKNGSWQKEETPLQAILGSDNQQERADCESPKPHASACRDEEVPLTPLHGLDCKSEPYNLCKTERQRCTSPNAENKEETSKNPLNGFASVYYSDQSYGWHPCTVCGQTKPTSWQAETFKHEKLWLCEDCKTKWEKLQEATQ